MRNPATAKVVLTNRTDPPDAILREVWQRSGGQRFERIEDVISADELQAISDRYKKVAGFDRETLKDAAELRLKQLRLKRMMAGGELAAAAISRSAGTSAAQTASARGQRVRKRQPDGGSSGDGGSPTAR